MKNLLLILKNNYEYINFNLVNEVLNAFGLANFKISDTIVYDCENIDKLFENFSQLRQAYGNVFILNYGCNKFEISNDKIKDFIYNDSHYENDFSLFIIEKNEVDCVKNTIIPFLERKYCVKFGKVIFKTYGISRDKIIEKTSQIEKQTNVKFDVFENNLDCKVEIIFDDKSTKMEYDLAQKQFLATFSDNVYADSDVSLEKILVDLLKLRKCVLSTAESFTGGNISAKITSVSGASQVFYESIVCYNENSKHLRLGVKQSTLSEFKPVSAQVAGEMAFGLVKDRKANIGISTTGIAGPNSDDSNFPVGLCYIGIACDGEIKVYRYNFDGDRQAVIDKGTKTAMFLAVKTIKNI